MLCRTATAASHSLIVASSSNASKSFANFNHSVPRFLGFGHFSRTLSDCSSSGSVSFGWNSSGKRRFSRSGMESFTVRASAQPLKNADELIDSVETFIFDCDGVIWKGDKLIDGVPETLDMLRSKGKRLVFVTNNSTKSRKQYGKKFETLGLNVTEEEIFASSFAAAAYLKSINFPKEKKVYVIGEDGILKELELAGYQYLGGPDDGGKKIELKPGFLMEHDEDVGAVVVGFDRYFNYYKVQYGTLCIRENPGCLFIATNRDAVTHLTDAQEWAGGGSMVGALCGSTQREPLVVGKPSTFMMDYLANKFGILKSQICMVGDRLDTDILFGQNGGCKTLLVLSGVTSLATLESPNNSIQPDFYTNQISDFLSLKAAPGLGEIVDRRWGITGWAVGRARLGTEPRVGAEHRARAEHQALRGLVGFPPVAFLVLCLGVRSFFGPSRYVTGRSSPIRLQLLVSFRVVFVLHNNGPHSQNRRRIIV